MTTLATEFKFRTEDIRKEDIQRLFVSTTEDRKTVDMLKAPSPIILEGSRGTGKSFLLRVAEVELEQDFDKGRVLPAYVSFVKSSLIYTNDEKQFQHWMLAKICSRLLRAFRAKGIGLPSSPAMTLLSGGGQVSDVAPSPLEALVSAYESSYKSPNSAVDPSGVPDVEDFKDAVEDICRTNDIQRVVLFFDEAIHIFRAEQQRQFFTLFRDLRSPFISCNAAVYPGVTSYGSVFELTHDATHRRLERDILAPNYIENMKEIVSRQAESDTSLLAAISRRGENFAILAYCVSGNPRLLLKTIAKCPELRNNEVNDLVKSFYRSTIWAEHSGLAESYSGHLRLIEWGRTFVETEVLPQTKAKNDKRMVEGQNESTCYFWIHKDAPEPVKHALRLLAYTGIVQKGDDGIRGTRSELGTRYSVNFGCLLALEANPVGVALELAKNLSIKRFSEFGSNHHSFDSIKSVTLNLEGPDTLDVLNQQLGKSINELDLTPHQESELTRIGVLTIGQVLKADEAIFIEKMHYVGPVRARKIKNAADHAVLEYLSG